MGNWNRHFVRVGSDGNMGVFDQRGNRFIRENLGSDNKPSQIVFIPSSTDLNDNTYPTEHSASVFMSDPYGNTRLNPQTSLNINLSNTRGGTLAINGAAFSIEGVIGYYLNQLKMYGFQSIQGSPDLRIGVTAADASPITIFSSTQSGTRYEVKARILATAGTSATYTISWTEGGAVRTVALTVTAAGTEVHDNFVIAPDSGTNITAQITSLTSSTVNVDAIVSVLG